MPVEARAKAGLSAIVPIYRERRWKITGNDLGKTG